MVILGRYTTTAVIPVKAGIPLIEVISNREVQPQ